MKLKQQYIILIGFSFILSILFSFEVKAQSNLTIIGSTGSVPAEMDMYQLQSVLRGEQIRWQDGVKVKIALMKTNTPIGTVTSEKIFEMTGNELNKHFLSLVFAGKAKAPTFFNSTSELEAYVANTPGAIGVLENTSNEQTKVVVVDGKKQI
jgi:hypothetical protein